MEKIDLLNIEFNEENLEVQKFYFHILDKILDAVILLKYKNTKNQQVFVSNAQIYDRMLSCFKEAEEREHSEKEIEKFAIEITRATDDIKDYEKNKKLLESYYDLYQKQRHLTHELTTPFFNHILNNQQNHFCKNAKRIEVERLKRGMPLTKKKENQIVRSKKIEEMRCLFRKGQYRILGLTEEKVMVLIEKLNEKIQCSPYFEKKNIVFSKKQLYELGKLFFTGNLTNEMIEGIITGNLSKEVLSHIKNIYYREMLPSLERIPTDALNIARKDIKYDYNNIKLVTNGVYQYNWNQLTFKLGPDILAEENNREFIKLLPVVGRVQGFGLIEMEEILKYSTQVLQKLKEENPNFKGTLKEILNQFAKVLHLARIYSNTTPLVRKVLGEEAVTKILNIDRMASNDPKKYLPIYQEMLKRTVTHIPVISGKYQNYTYENGNMSDRMRLLIGANTVNSCLGPDGGGEVAYTKALTEGHADVLLIKDEKKEFVARTLIFRKGNSLMMSLIKGENGIQQQFFNKEFLNKIATEFLNQAAEVGDNLEYVFMTMDSDSKKELTNCPLIMNWKLVDTLPHVDDWTYCFYLIGGDEANVHIELGHALKSYPQTRERIYKKEEITKEDIERIDALNIFMQQKEESTFTTINIDEYEYLYKGQDWYYGVTETKDETLMMLPTKDKRQSEEVRQIQKMLANIDKENSSFAKVKK